MPRQGSPSPAGRPQLEQRQSSSQSLPKGSPTMGHLSKANKGSSTRLHKTHAVGHGRHTHGRVPSYGKGLHKLSKLRPDEPEDGAGQTRQHIRSASQTPTGSPTSQTFRRSGSNVSLPRTGSKVSMKKNASNISLTRNVSSTKLGNHPKSEKAQLKNGLRKRGTASFEVGDDDDQDDGDWEDNSSQSPYTTRSNSARPKSPLSRDPPSPDEPPDRLPKNLSTSPPDSLPKKSAESTDLVDQDRQREGNGSRYSQPPNAEDVTYRLLSRNPHNAEPKMTTVSASITPNGSASPVFRNRRDSGSFNKEPSMPADGISRFLGTNSNSGSGTPGSVFQLQDTLANLQQAEQNERQRSQSPSVSGPAINGSKDHRVIFALDLSHSNLKAASSTSTSPLKSPTESNSTTDTTKKKKKTKKLPPVSPYESARGLNPNAGKSVTQLKIDLQRMATLRDTPPSQHPLLQTGTMIGMQHFGTGGEEIKARYAREYNRAQAEFRNAVRFYPDVVRGRLNKRGMKERLERLKAAETRKREGGKGKARLKTPVGSSDDASVSRGRVRFDVGRSPAEEEEEEERGSADEGDRVEGVRGLLERMWAQTDGMHRGEG